MSYKVRLEAFEGPFDLLVYLIENARMSIYDIHVSEITAQYLDYLDSMREMDVYVGTEFMVLAAELVELKSKMLLPHPKAAGPGMVEEDPRSELVQRLVEYKRFKDAAAMLSTREEAARRRFCKPQEDLSIYTSQADEYLKLDIRQFAAAFRLFLQRKQTMEAVRRNYTRVERERARVEERMHRMTDMLRRNRGHAMHFFELVTDGGDLRDVVVTFMSLLEMIKERIAEAEQKSTYGDIMVSPGPNVDAALDGGHLTEDEEAADAMAGDEDPQVDEEAAPHVLAGR